MINSINSNNRRYNKNFRNNNNEKTIHTTIASIQDFHGKTGHMERYVTVSKQFDTKYKNRQDVDYFKLSSGDILIGEDPKINDIAVFFQKKIGISDGAIGNHEFDTQNYIKKLFPKMNYNLLACNIKIDKNSPWNGKVLSSRIEEKNGHKYGIIGASPVDLHKRSKQGPIQSQIKVDNVNNTIKDIQKEVNRLEKQGVNKIILLSHLGYDLDKVVATNTTGVDIILGGHSHDLIFDITENENLLYSKNGEPVVITQYGRDGKNFGLLDIEFGQDGVIRKVQNNVGFTKDFKRDPITKILFDKILGVKENYGKIHSAPPPLVHDLIEPNPHAYFITDCIKKDFDADIAILPSANIRGYFEEGNVDTRTLDDILPFKNKLYEVNYSEKDIVDAIKNGARSFVHTANKPGIFYASGLKYSVTTNGEVLSISFIDKNNQEIPIDINNPRTDKFYKTIINDFCAQGNDGFTMLNRPNNIVEKYPYDATLCVKKFMKSTTKPIDIKDDGRITVIKTTVEA